MTTGIGRIRAPVAVVLGLVVYLASSLVPRRAGLWVFGAAGGTQFVGSPKYQFLHVEAEHGDEIRAVWLTTNDDVLDGLRSAGFEAYRADGWRGRWLTLRAEAVFTSHGVGDVAKWCTGGATIVQLWHGLALKRIGRDVDREWSLAGRMLFDLFASNWDRLVVTGRAQVDVFAAAYPIERDDVLVAGYPRNDALVRSFPGENAVEASPVDRSKSAVEASPADRSESVVATKGAGEPHGRICGSEADPDNQLGGMKGEPADSLEWEGPLLAYVPTWRRGFGGQAHGRPISESDLDFGRLDGLLDRYDARLLVKLHPADRGEIGLTGFERIVPYPSDADVYLTLRDVDALITDYSSIYFDFLHLDRPILFFAYDLERYERRPGFYYDYETVTPGPVATSGAELLTELEAVLSGNDECRPERRRVRDRFFDRSDGRAAERVYECVRADVDSREASSAR